MNYIVNIHKNAIANAQVSTVIECPLKFEGEYFESLGDIFINLLDNVISNNRELGNDLKVDIVVKAIKDNLQIEVKNNMPKNRDIKELAEIIETTKQKIENYKGSELSATSFEQGSGFLKISKSITVDLKRDKYEIIPQIKNDNFEVFITFPLDHLIK